MDNTRLVITGIGAVSHLGVGLEHHIHNLPSPVSPDTYQESEYHSFDQPVSCFRAQHYDPVEVLGKKGLRTKDWSTKMLLGAIEPSFKETFEQADEDHKPGICIGTAFGSVQSIGDFLSDSIVNGVNSVNPQAFANTVINSPTGNANIRYTVRTLSTTVSTGFNAGIDALIYSGDYIRRGYLDAVLVGGIEEISYFELLGLQRSGVLSSRSTSRPFGKDADGLVMGEGGAVFLLESEESASRRGAKPVAEVVGYYSAFDADAPVSGFDASGNIQKYVMKNACDTAGVSCEQISFIAASANGNKTADTIESQAIARLFGDTPVTSYKARIGECYGAGAPLSVACALADSFSSRITGIGEKYETPGDANILFDTRGDYISEYVLVNSFSCDGNCASIILKNIM
ncbi:MAG: beta-ketoacyl-[acyl-carrier-protein] synthase family protein [Chitinivibrionales bacterium]